MYRYKHAIKENINDNYWIIFGKCMGWLALGLSVGLLFFYVFKDFSVTAIDRFKFLQGIFGISEYQKGMLFGRVISTILIANLISTAAYFALGYFRLLIPIAIITGFFIMLLLMTGVVRHQQAIPLEVILLMAGETFYRVLALTTGEHLHKNRLRKSWVFFSSIGVVLVFYTVTALYEVFQIFGYIIAPA
jgi:hypothetical protein